jgi:histidinol-phosphate aminotransferase
MNDDTRARAANEAPSASAAVPQKSDAELQSSTTIVGQVRADVRALVGYSTGEQQPGFLKLNTNESPYPPSPRVHQALAQLGDDALRQYPDPVSRRLCEVAASLYGVATSQILAGNGSDDCLTVLYRTFLAPGDIAACPWPSYGLYDTLAGLQGSRIVHVEYPSGPDGRVSDWSLPEGLSATGARLTLIANPNNPSSTMDPVASLRRLARQLDGILVVDEAYVDFALATDPGASMLPYLDDHPNLVVLRTFSKSYSLAGARLGLMFAAAPLVAQMNKVKDSYNVNVLTQALGVAALEDRAHHAHGIARIVSERGRLERELAALGWSSPPAFGNFLLCHVGPQALRIQEAMRARKILLRHWNTPRLRHELRITVGTPEQNGALLAAARAVL